MTYTTQIRNTHYTLDNSDIFFLTVAPAAFFLTSTYHLYTNPGLFSIAITLIYIILASGLVGITLHSAHQTYEFNTYGNVIGQMEAIQNHALAEGY